MSDPIVLTALQCSQNGKEFYVTVINSDILKPNICYVARRDEDPTKGFQRSLSESRAKDIARYLDKEKGVIPSSIILSAQDNIDLTFDPLSKKNERFFGD